MSEELAEEVERAIGRFRDMIARSNERADEAELELSRLRTIMAQAAVRLRRIGADLIVTQDTRDDPNIVDTIRRIDALAVALAEGAGVEPPDGH